MSAAPAIRCTGVEKALGGRPVLRGVDLEVARGTILALVGPSGAGKTTLLRAIAGLEGVDRGTVEVAGSVVDDGARRAAPETRAVGMVFQSLELWPHMTAAENVAFGIAGRPRGRAALDHARVAEVANEVGLPLDLLARRPPTLSGGERQRVAIARALAPRPAVVLYDEALASLDPERRAEIRRLLRSLAGRGGATFVHVTHDAAEALEMGDSVAVLDGGRVVERGAPSDVYRRPASLAAARALGPASVLAATRRDDRVETSLGVFPAGGAGPVDAVALRPEQVVLAAEGESGAEAEVVDSFAAGRDWAFTARVAGRGEQVDGRSVRRLAPGSRVRLKVLGEPAPLSGTRAPGSAG